MSVALRRGGVQDLPETRVFPEPSGTSGAVLVHTISCGQVWSVFSVQAGRAEWWLMP